MIKLIPYATTFFCHNASFALPSQKLKAGSERMIAVRDIHVNNMRHPSILFELRPTLPAIDKRF
jgi:hypothetical protein